MAIQIKKKKGFTLIELLVVIAIIALLLSIIVPALKRSKEKAKTIQCKANLKGQLVAMKLYLGENDSEYPLSYGYIVNGYPGTGVPALQPLECQWHNRLIDPGVNPTFAGALWPYVETMKSSLCPTFWNYARFSGHTSCSVPFNPVYSYSQNHFLGYSTYGVKKESEIYGPASVLVFVEETIWKITEPAPKAPLAAIWILNDTCFMARHPADSEFPGDTIATYHETSTAAPNKGKGNTVFVDGHVDLSNPWDTEIISGKEYRRSFLLSFPKRGARDTAKPY